MAGVKEITTGVYGESLFIMLNNDLKQVLRDYPENKEKVCDQKYTILKN